MGLRINNNIAALNSYNNVNRTDRSVSGSLEKLSSGLRINKAADDASGLVISENLRSQIGGLTVASRNAQDGVNVVQTADGALGTVTSMVQRMRDLATQAANATADQTARDAADAEFQQLGLEIDRLAGTTKFGKTNLLDGQFGQKSAVVSGSLAASTTGSTTVAATAEFKLTLGAGTQSANINVGGSYATAGDYQKTLQSKIDGAMATANPTTYTAGDIKASVSDNGSGVWVVSLTSSKGALDLAVGTTASSSTTDAGLGAVRTVALPASSVSGKFQVGANANETIDVAIGAVSRSALGLTGDLKTAANAQAAITATQGAIGTVSSTRATLGALQNRFEYTINNLSVSIENITASESAIRDTDMAAEMTKFTKNQILSQAGTSMLAQANSSTQNILTLLRG